MTRTPTPGAIGSGGRILSTTTGRLTRAPAAVRSFSRRTFSSFEYSGEAVACGFTMKSTAPSSRARKTSSRLCREETTIVGVGRFDASHRRTEKPSSPGISRSRVMRSGSCAIARRIASSPLTAAATTFISGSDSIIRERVTREKALSSATRTRIISGRPCRSSGGEGGTRSRRRRAIPRARERDARRARAACAARRRRSVSPNPPGRSGRCGRR